MSLPPVVLPGTQLTTHYLNALREAARRGNTQVAGPGLSALDTPGGMLVNQNPETDAVPAGCIKCELVEQPYQTATTTWAMRGDFRSFCAPAPSSKSSGIRAPTRTSVKPASQW